MVEIATLVIENQKPRNQEVVREYIKLYEDLNPEEVKNNQKNLRGQMALQ